VWGFVHSSSKLYWIRRRRKPLWDMTLHHFDIWFLEDKTTMLSENIGQIPSNASYPSKTDFSSTQLHKTKNISEII